jgi:hypothetical protein
MLADSIESEVFIPFNASIMFCISVVISGDILNSSKSASFDLPKV